MSVRTTAGSKVETLNFNETQLAFARGFFSQRQLRGLLRRDVVDCYFAILPNYVVRQFNSTFDHFITWAGKLDVNFAGVMQHPKAARGRFEQSDESLRENVLAGVLLDVVEA